MQNSHEQADSTAAGQTPIRVCMVSFYFHPEYSGSAVQAANLCRHLRDCGIRSFVVSARLSGGKKVDEIAGLRVFRLPVLKRLEIVSFWLSLALFLVRHRKEYDVIHVHGTVRHSIAAVIGRLLGKRTILKVAMANSDIAFHRQGRLWGGINRYLVLRFDRFIATSKDVLQEFRKLGFPREAVHLVPNGVDTQKFRPPVTALEKTELRGRLGLPEGPVVSFVGIINRRKNVDFILRVWKQLVERGVAGHVVLVGPLPSKDDAAGQLYYSELQAYIAANGLAGRVSFVGHQEAVADFLRASDIFFFPSRQEGMPNVLLEAMASGLPCVVSRISGTEDLVEHNVTGLILPLEDEPGFVAGLRGLLDDPSRARAIGAAARAYVENGLSLRGVARRYQGLYQELLAL